MRRTLLLIVIVITASCSSLRKSPSGGDEGGIVITRKYVGNYVDHRLTGPENYDGPNIIWIKTTMEATYGVISAYGRRCDFAEGDRIYIRRVYYSPGIVSGYWVYYVENDEAVSYRATDLQHDREVFIKAWFE